jgi:hypothetical protein
MSAASITIARPAADAPPGRHWIVSRGVDLSLIIGSAAAGYIYLVLYAAMHVPISLLWWFWSVGFDGTHIFGTASRTFFDAQARARYPKLLFGSLLVFFSIGPIMVLAGGKPLLALIVGVWAYYHVVRQHYGFMVLYKVKTRDLGKLDNFLDRVFLGVTMVFPPFHRFFIHHPEELGVPFSFPWLDKPLWVLVGVVVVGYVVRQLMRIARGDQPNRQKFLLFGAVIPLHWLTFHYMSWLAAVPTVTIVHNLQYHAIIWFHNRNRYATDASGERNGRIPAAVSRSLLAYVAIGLVFSALYRIPGFHLGQVSDLAFGFFAGFGLTHYYLDSRIWRVRHDPELREVLQLA